MGRVHKAAIRVRYKDTDKMGVVYYGNFFTWFEIARSEFMRAVGLPYSDLEDMGCVLAVTEASANYYGNTKYDAIVNVKTWITKVTGVRVRFEYEISDEQNKILSKGFTVHACVGKDMKPARMPEKALKFLQEVSSR